MALSNSFSFSVTATDIINEAMLNVGALGPGEVATAQEFSDCLRKLNMLAKQWMGKQDFAPGLKMWTRARGDLFLSSSKGQYLLGPTGDNWAGGVATSSVFNFQTTTLLSPAVAGANTLNLNAVSQITVSDFLVIQLDSGDIFSTSVGSISGSVVTLGNGNTMPSQSSSGSVWNYTIKGQRPLAILTGTLRDSNNNDVSLNVMTLEDYELLPTKTASAYTQDPTAWYYESQIGSQVISPLNSGGGVLYLDCGGAQDVTKTLHFVYLRPTMDLVNPGDNPEYPQQWYRGLCWGLSREITAMFDAEWTKDMDTNLQDALSMCRQADAETSTLYFESDADSV